MFLRVLITNIIQVPGSSGRPPWNIHLDRIIIIKYWIQLHQLVPVNKQHMSFPRVVETPPVMHQSNTGLILCCCAKTQAKSFREKKKPTDLVQSKLLFLRKLKKLFRKLKDERTEVKEMDTDQSKDPQQWDLDYILEPFTGLTPEYMEMSKFSEFSFPFCNNHGFTQD